MVSACFPCDFIFFFFSNYVFVLIIRSPVVSVTMTCHILSVMGDIASNLNDDTKARIVGKCCGSGLQNGTEVIVNVTKLLIVIIIKCSRHW